MSSEVDRTELSGYLDGELSAARAREIEAAIAGSPALRMEVNELAEADNAWRTAARSDPVRPEIRLPRHESQGLSAIRVAGGMTLLLAVRILPKLAGTFESALVVNGIALAIALIWAARKMMDDRREANI